MGGSTSKDGKEMYCFGIQINNDSSGVSNNRRKHIEVKCKPVLDGYPSYSRTKIERCTFVVPSRYKIIKTIGHGAYGRVVDAEDVTSGEHYAIKRMSEFFGRNEFEIKRVLREVILMKRFNHPNVVKLIDIFPPPASTTEFSEIYIIVNLMQKDLKYVINNVSKLKISIQIIEYLIYQIFCGLKYLHGADIVHRDLKPENILINMVDCSVRICDFGLSRVMNENDYATCDVVTIWYRAPELLLESTHDYAHYSAAIDVWSLGCILLELLNMGKTPFELVSHKIV